MPHYRGVAQFGLERFIWDEEVAGSNPATPTILVIGESLWVRINTSGKII